MRNVIVTGVPRADLGIVDQLAALGVATVHEAVGRSGYLGPGLRPIQHGTRTGGTAVTALCWPGDNLMIHAGVEQCQAGDLLVVTTTSPCTDGMFGELLATSLAARGVRGLVIEAGVRDVAELRAMGFGVWSAAVSAQGTVKETAGSVNVPICVGGQIIRPGDAIIADDDGVVCVPRADVSQALAAARARVAREEQNRQALAGGRLGLDLYGLRDKLAARGVEYVAAGGDEGLMSTAGTGGVRCMLMRGGTSKGAYFLAEDLPADPEERDDLLLRIMGSPDVRQIDGIGGAHPLTSKVAVVSASVRSNCDVDYLFLQVGVDAATVSDRQNCGNLLAGVGPFAVERGLAVGSPVRIHMVNSGGLATATFHGADGAVEYEGGTAIAGVPGTAAAIVLDFAGTQGSSTGALLPTGNVADVIEGVTVTCVDNGMPVVMVPAAALGRTGYETVAELEADAALGGKIRALRLAAGALMGLGDVSAASVPKVSLIAAPAAGGTICTRTFIPVRVHDSIGVLGAVSVATALLLAGAAGGGLAVVKPGQTRFDIEHPTGHLEVEAELDQASQPPRVIRSGVVRTARKLFDGTVFPRRPGRGTQAGRADPPAQVR